MTPRSVVWVPHAFYKKTKTKCKILKKNNVESVKPYNLLALKYENFASKITLFILIFVFENDIISIFGIYSI